jgi:hypothetical protein
MRLFSLSWALLAAGGAALAAAVLAWRSADPALDPLLRAAGCGLFYGLLAFHLQRVDPDDGHLQAGLVGAVCGIRSLAQPLALPPLVAADPQGLAEFLRTAVLEALRGWLPLWLPLVASALLLRLLVRGLPLLRP